MRGVGNAEDFRKLAYNIAYDDTPLYSMLKKEGCSNDKFEWVEDTLAAPAQNLVVEAASISATQVTVPTRYYNYTQQMEKTFVISDKQQTIQQKQGGSFSSGKQLMNRTTELKRDANYALWNNAAQSAGSTAAATFTAGIPYYVGTAIYTAGLSVDGGSAAITEAGLLSAMQKVYETHVPGNMVIGMSPLNKMRVDAFSGGAVKQASQTDKKITNTIKVYESSFGSFMMFIERSATLANTDVYVLDLDLLKIRELMPIEHKQLGYTKHAEEHMVQTCFGLECGSPYAHARIRNLSAS
jgi:hypothetical protein